MNNSVRVRFLGDMRPYNNFTSHILPPPEIWFETEHFEFLSFRAQAQFLACSQNEIKITLEEKTNGFWQIGEIIWSPLEEMNKTQKSFRNRRILIFQPNFVKTQFSQKSRWFSSETVEGGCEKINKGYKNLEFFDETSNIP